MTVGRRGPCRTSVHRRRGGACSASRDARPRTDRRAGVAAAHRERSRRRRPASRRAGRSCARVRVARRHRRRPSPCRTPPRTPRRSSPTRDPSGVQPAGDVDRRRSRAGARRPARRPPVPPSPRTGCGGRLRRGGRGWCRRDVSRGVATWRIHRYGPRSRPSRIVTVAVPWRQAVPSGRHAVSSLGLDEQDARGRRRSRSRPPRTRSSPPAAVDRRSPGWCRVGRVRVAVDDVEGEVAEPLERPRSPPARDARRDRASRPGGRPVPSGVSCRRDGREARREREIGAIGRCLVRCRHRPRRSPE